MRLWLVKESKKKCSKIEKSSSPVDSELSLSMSKIAHDLLDSKEAKSSFSDKRRRVVDCCSFSSQPALGSYKDFRFEKSVVLCMVLILSLTCVRTWKAHIRHTHIYKYISNRLHPRTKGLCCLISLYLRLGALTRNKNTHYIISSNFIQYNIYVVSNSSNRYIRQIIIPCKIPTRILSNPIMHAWVKMLIKTWNFVSLTFIFPDLCWFKRFCWKLNK